MQSRDKHLPGQGQERFLSSVNWKLLPDRLHVGCGQVKMRGWVNIDLDSTKADLLCDIRNGLPCPDSSMNFIYNEHVLEHLKLNEGNIFLKEAFRVLKPNGVLRIAMPDLDNIIEKFTGNWRAQDWLQWPEHKFIETRVQMINIAFREWEHQYLYNKEELHYRLKQSGFEKIESFRNGESNHEVFRGLETRKDSLLIAEATR